MNKQVILNSEELDRIKSSFLALPGVKNVRVEVVTYVSVVTTIDPDKTNARDHIYDLELETFGLYPQTSFDFIVEHERYNDQNQKHTTNTLHRM